VEKLKILIVEDNLEYIKAAEKAFQNFEMEVAETYAEAEKLVEKFKVDIAFVDMYFPKAKGLEQECMGIKFGKELQKKGIPFLIVKGNVGGQAELWGWDPIKDDSECVTWLDQLFSPKTEPKTWKDAMDYLMEEVLETTLEEFLKKK
jgi:CheY-like chemotaxis protein